jgi:hypothetical protein
MSTSDQKTIGLEEAFQKRMEQKRSNKVIRKKLAKELDKKRAAKKESFMPTLGDDVPKYCTLKTVTFYDFMTEVGTVAQNWKEEARNLSVVNPGNPVSTLLVTNVSRMADLLVGVLQKYVEIIKLDNIEMQEGFNAQQEKGDKPAT